MTDATYVPDDRRTKRNVAVLVAAQAVLGSQITMIFVIGGLAGQMLAPNACFATLPISLIVFGSMTTAPWLSRVMQRRGRRTGFLIGAAGGLAGSAIGAAGLLNSSFPLFLAGSYFTGMYMSAQGFYRFAAADSASEAFRPKAISYVMAGGLISAIIGPQMVKVTHDLFPVPFLGTYMVAMSLNLLGMGLFFLLDLPRPAPRRAGARAGRTVRELLATPEILVAIICGMVSYGLMNLVMTSTPLAVVGCGYAQDSASDIVTGHVLAMFVPSFFTGHLIARFGAPRIVAAGLAILALAGFTALSGVELGHFFGALILLGIGWNFGFIGATAMLAQQHTGEERGLVQGLNDAMVFGCVTFASLASGGLMNCSGGTPVEGWSAVNMAMAPFLVLAGGALIWLALRPKEA
ncbi:MFS transporter [Mangrovicoccus sp. HB161399]|uniref:MFS transporter n=1 Tax=Mangrovicoccus sp. HB161399 TaxID=2720392 RepID=UPI001556388D|nr:MFS transporter [Mangrovicoccus sp. HB161399]